MTSDRQTILIEKPERKSSRYDAGLLEDIRRYIDHDWQASGEPVPTVAGLLCALQLPRSTFYDLANKHEDVKQLLDRLLAIQESTLVSGSLKGTLNPSIAKLLLMRHGYSERIEQTVDHTTGGDKMQPATFKGVTKHSRTIEHDDIPEPEPEPEKLPEPEPESEPVKMFKRVRLGPTTEQVSGELTALERWRKGV